MAFGLYKNGGECVLSELPLLDRILCSKSIDPNFFAPKWLDPLNQWGMGLNHLCYQGLTRSLCKEIYEIERVENYGTVSFYQLHAASIFWAATVFSSQGPVSPGPPGCQGAVQRYWWPPNYSPRGCLLPGAYAGGQGVVANIRLSHF